MAQEVFAADPGASGKTVSRRARKRIENKLKDRRLNHSLSLDVQGKLLHIVHPNAAAVWV